MLSADVVTLHCESKERHLRLVQTSSTPHGSHLHTGMQGIGTTHARHRNGQDKGLFQRFKLRFLRPAGSKRPSAECRPPLTSPRSALPLAKEGTQELRRGSRARKPVALRPPRRDGQRQNTRFLVRCAFGSWCVVHLSIHLNMEDDVRNYSISVKVS